MREYEIWSEGFSFSCEEVAPARFICKQSGTDFRDACDRAYAAGKFEGYGNYCPEVPSLYACRLYETEAAARKTFG